MERERIVVLSGAGVSAESGLRTFRSDSATGGGALWEEYRVEDVATPGAWERDPALVLRFYDQRRAQVLAARPNAAHLAIAALERAHHVDVVTQNIDDLHERAGSTRVLHLHGEVLKARSTADPHIVLPIAGPSLRLGDLCPRGAQLRPHIVWFGEPVPLIRDAEELIARADRLIIVGTSLQVYPAAGAVNALRPGRPAHVIDPEDVPYHPPGVEHIRQTAGAGMPALAARLLGKAQ